MIIHKEAFTTQNKLDLRQLWTNSKHNIVPFVYYRLNFEAELESANGSNKTLIN